MPKCETVKVKPWSKDQGDFVIINKDEFDKNKHELLKQKKKKGK
jgi:hypothetical protein